MSLSGEIRLFHRKQFDLFLIIQIDRKENGSKFITENDCKSWLYNIIYSIMKDSTCDFYVVLFIYQAGVIIYQHPKHDTAIFITPEFHPVYNNPLC
jgi:hypothetical protein